MEIETDAIVAKNRKLKAVWTVECDKDLRSLYALHDQKELFKKLQNDIKNSIDQEILNDLKNNSEVSKTTRKRRKLRDMYRSIDDD